MTKLRLGHEAFEESPTSGGEQFKTLVRLSYTRVVEHRPIQVIRYSPSESWILDHVDDILQKPNVRKDSINLKVFQLDSDATDELQRRFEQRRKNASQKRP